MGEPFPLAHPHYGRYLDSFLNRLNSRSGLGSESRQAIAGSKASDVVFVVRPLLQREILTGLLTSTSELVFYAGTLPFLTIIWAAASLGLTLAKVLAPIAALASSVVLFCGWIPQIGIWLYCEVGAPNVNEHVPNWCPTSPINTAKDSYNVAYNVGLGKDFLGLVIAVALIASIILVAIAMSRRRKRGMEDHVLKTVPVDSPVLTS